MGSDSSIPSIKGSAFQSAVADVRRLADEGRLDLDDLGLSAKERALIDSVTTPVSWMPIATYDRLLKQLCSVEGGVDATAYLRKRGARAAERLFSESYSSYQVEPGSWSPRVAETFIGISTLLYNFGSWQVTHDTSDAISFLVEDAEAMPDTAIEAARGFLYYFAELAADCPIELRFVRYSPSSFAMKIRTKPRPA